MPHFYSSTHGFFGCYCLESQSDVWRGSSYIGFTTNPRRRVRQHNGELAHGARRTRARRPWHMVLFVGPFTSEVAGLRFEWSWTHPARSARLRRHGAGAARPAGVVGTLRTLDAMLHTPPWALMPLTVSWVRPVSPAHRALLHVPPTMREVEVALDECSFDTGRCKLGRALGLGAGVSGEEEGDRDSLCPICFQPMQTSPRGEDLHFLPARCVSCRTRFCVRCLAAAGSAKPNKDTGTGVVDGVRFSSLIPRTVKCPICKVEQLWADVLRARNEEASELRSTG